MRNVLISFQNFNTATKNLPPAR